MKHTTSRLLFAYWDGLRRERAAPDRAEIAPGAIRHILADTFILAAEGEDRATFRLAGTRCDALFGRRLQGTAFRDLWPADAAAEPDKLVATVTAETAGLVVGLLGQASFNQTLPLELLLLPLRYRGQPHVRLIGTFSPASLPSWIGLTPIEHVETTSLRVVTIGRSGRHAGAGVAGPPQSELRRPVLVVHEGGRR
ncbi:MAG: PAS domain-containing protein [Methylobacteriaceae bacterium]|nr:PAS domain-containing protein [Methylobacteriaceae bacterium]